MSNQNPPEEELEEDSEQFGEVAVRLGYCTEHDVTQALDYQKELESENGEHKLIGMIMLENGFLSSDQLISILRVMNQQRENSVV